MSDLKVHSQIISLQVPSENTKDSVSSVDLTVESPSAAEKSTSTAQLKPTKSKMQAKKSKDKMAATADTIAASVSFTDMKQSSSLNHVKWKLLNCADSIVREMLKVTFVPKTVTDCKIFFF